MRILCLGDVVGFPGQQLLKKRLRDFREEHGVDFCIVNAENSHEGSGVKRENFKLLRDAGADVCTTGDHVFKRADILKLFKLHLPSACPVKGVLHRMTELLYLARPPNPARVSLCPHKYRLIQSLENGVRLVIEIDDNWKQKTP